ncbi:MAG: CpaF family protein [Bacteroidales bacterium]|nr:CpaF family protein [Bacteroidales bacterium]
MMKEKTESILHKQIGISLSPIKEYIEDTEVTDIIIFGYKKVCIKKRGEKLFKTDIQWASRESLRTAANQIARNIKRPLDAERPIVDARLPDNSRVNIVIDPVYGDGAYIAIRKFPEKVFKFEDLRGFGTIDDTGITILRNLVYLGKNIIISGGTGSGKTTLLNAAASIIPKDQIIVTIEDAREIVIDQPYWAALEAKKKIYADQNEVTLSDLVKTSLRMSPSWIIVGEVRGNEVQDLLRAFNTGHSGIGTVHANTAKDSLGALQRLLIKATNTSMRAAKEEIAAAVDIIVQVSRLRDETRKVMEILEINGTDEDGNYLTKSIYGYTISGIDREGKIIGNHQLREVPNFLEEMKEKALEIPAIW